MAGTGYHAYYILMLLGQLLQATRRGAHAEREGCMAEQRY